MQPPRKVNMKIQANDGDCTIAVGHLTVTLDFEGEISFMVSDSQHAEKHDGSVGLELTGFGAFTTMRLIRPAVEALIALADEQGKKWWVQPTCPRRHKLYSRYIDESRILKGY